VGSGPAAAPRRPPSIPWRLRRRFRTPGAGPKPAGERQQASDDLQRLLLNNLPAGVVIVDPMTRIIEQVNEHVVALFGAPGENLVGRRCHAFLCPASEGACPVCDLGQVVDNSDRIMLRADGSRLSVMKSVKRIRLDGQEKLLECFVDVSARTQAEEALRESEARYRILFNLASEGILAHSLDGRFLEVNETFTRMHGCSREEMLGMTLADITPPGFSNMPPERLQRVLAGASVTYEVEHIHKDGHVFPLEVVAGLVASEGRSIILAFHRDITERRRMEEEKARLEARLQQTQRVESLALLAGGVAHDMNNVLGAILGLASANQKVHQTDDRAREAFATIAKAAIRGGTMVKSLLTLARQNPAEQRELDLNGILREEAQLLERTTLSKVAVTLDLAPDLRPIQGDAGALAHAFMNLCVNAVDAMADRGILTLRTRNLDQDWIEVRVQDTGSGMPREVLERAFDPFFTTKPLGKGTGLGLPIVYGTVKAHQGAMEVQSEPGRGTLVILRFPACRAPAREPKAEAEARPDPGGKPLEVLLVDDDELVLGSIQEVLEILGHQVLSLRSGEEALARVEAGCRPDVVILDMNMPGLGGAGTLSRLLAVLPGLPIILATGRADQAVLNLVAAHPQVSLLPKPFTIQDLERSLRAANLG
jgi:PAS domain S-box-containing protein